RFSFRDADRARLNLVGRHRRQRLHVLLARPDPDDALERLDEDLAVADLARARARDDRRDRRLDERFGNGDVDAHLLDEFEDERRASVLLDGLVLAAVALY